MSCSTDLVVSSSEAVGGSWMREGMGSSGCSTSRRFSNFIGLWTAKRQARKPDVRSGGVGQQVDHPPMSWGLWARKSQAGKPDVRSGGVGQQVDHLPISWGLWAQMSQAGKPDVRNGAIGQVFHGSLSQSRKKRRCMGMPAHAGTLAAMQDAAASGDTYTDGHSSTVGRTIPD